MEFVRRYEFLLEMGVKIGTNAKNPPIFAIFWVFYPQGVSPTLANTQKLS